MEKEDKLMKDKREEKPCHLLNLSIRQDLCPCLMCRRSSQQL